MTYDLYSSISIHKVLHIIYSFCYCIALSIVHVTKRELSSFFIMSSFALCDSLSGYLKRPNNSESNISHCCHWMHVYIIVALVCNSYAELIILNMQKYSDK